MFDLAWFDLASFPGAYSRRVRNETCRCGHERTAHDHYRSGSECALCPPGECAHFNRRSKGRLAGWLIFLFRHSSRDAQVGDSAEERRKDGSSGASASIDITTAS
ncbi:MAG: hypothetical protein WBO08_17845 [Mycobacterium sp.]